MKILLEARVLSSVEPAAVLRALPGSSLTVITTCSLLTSRLRATASTPTGEHDGHEEGDAEPDEGGVEACRGSLDGRNED